MLIVDLALLTFFQESQVQHAVSISCFLVQSLIAYITFFPENSNIFEQQFLFNYENPIDLEYFKNINNKLLSIKTFLIKCGSN